MQRNGIGERVLGLPREPSFDSTKPFNEVLRQSRELERQGRLTQRSGLPAGSCGRGPLDHPRRYCRHMARWTARRVAAVIGVALVIPMVTTGGTSAAADIGRVPAGSVLRVSVPEAIGGKTVIGQLTVDRVTDAGYVTAYGCDDGIPTDADGVISRSDLNFDAHASPVASNRLIVQADDNGDVCFYTLQAGGDDRRRQRGHVRYGRQLVPQPARRHADSANPRVPAGGVFRVVGARGGRRQDRGRAAHRRPGDERRLRHCLRLRRRDPHRRRRHQPLRPQLRR